MARSDAIASGSVTLVANADGLKTGLERAAKDVDGWGKRASKSGKETESSFKKTGDKLGDILGFSMKGIVATAAGNIGKAFIEQATGFAAFQRQLETIDAQIKQTMETMVEAAEARAKWFDVGTGAGSTAMNMERELKFLTAKLADERITRENAISRRSELENPFGSARNFLTWLGQRHGDTMEALTKPIAAADDRITELHKRIRETNARMHELLNPDIDPEKVRAVNEMSAALENQALKWNMDARELAIFEFKLKGFSDKQLDQYTKALDKSINAEHLVALDEFEKSLSRQAVLLAEGAKGAELYDLKMKGLSEEQMRWAGRLIDMREKLEQAAKPQGPIQLAGAMTPGSAQAYSVVMRNNLRPFENDTKAAQKATLEVLKKQLLNAIKAEKHAREIAEVIRAWGPV